jgi:hypothetical protein
VSEKWKKYRVVIDYEAKVSPPHSGSIRAEKFAFAQIVTEYMKDAEFTRKTKFKVEEVK